MTNELDANFTLGHYRIVSKIGAAGMDAVYLAQDTKLDRGVAIKLMDSLRSDPRFAGLVRRVGISSGNANC